MSNAVQTGEPKGLDLPVSAPQVRITAGFGSPTQKTWNLRRPVTLIGSRRPASIVLHDKEVSKAHCVIVNTGSDVLLKDLQTAGGTMCNTQRVDLVALADGDVVTIGGTKLQIAIQQPRDRSADDSGCGLEFVPPTQLPKPLILRLEHTDRRWEIAEAVALIGRVELAAVRLDRPEVSAREAILFRFQNSPAVFDLGSKDGISHNGQRCATARLVQGDRIGVGPFTLLVDDGAPTTAEIRAASAREVGSAIGESGTGKPVDVTADEAVAALGQIQADLASLEKSITGTWDRLNREDRPAQVEPGGLSVQALDLEARARALDARDAMLRGQMHDLTRYHEQLATKERDLAAQLARIQTRRDELTTLERTLTERDAELSKRAEEFKRREHVLAQRWTRLLSATCPHCGKPVNLNQPGPLDPIP